MLYSRTLLFVHSIYNSLHLLIPNSQKSEITGVPQKCCSSSTCPVLVHETYLKNLELHLLSSHPLSPTFRPPILLSLHLKYISWLCFPPPPLKFRSQPSFPKPIAFASPGVYLSPVSSLSPFLGILNL